MVHVVGPSFNEAPGSVVDYYIDGNALFVSLQMALTVTGWCPYARCLNLLRHTLCYLLWPYGRAYGSRFLDFDLDC